MVLSAKEKSKSSSESKKKRNLNGVLAGAFLLALSGCASISQTNANLYVDGADLDTRYNQLEKGMDMRAFLDVMGHDIQQQWNTLDNKQTTEVRCGCQLQVASLEEMEKAAEQLSKLSGFQIMYENVTHDPDYLGFKKEVDIEGYKVTMRFVFEDGKLMAWDRNGGTVNGKNTKPYIDFDGMTIRPGL